MIKIISMENTIMRIVILIRVKIMILIIIINVMKIK